MTKRMLMAMLALSMAATSVACGDDDDDDSEDDGGDGDGGDGDGGDGDGDDGDGSASNSEACENWKNSIDCDGANTAGIDAIDCSIYDMTTCDISAAFDCYADNTTCTNGQIDVSGIQGCANMLTCN